MMGSLWDTWCSDVPLPHITAHARLRFAQRSDLDDCEVEGFVAEAMRFGKRYHDFSGKYRCYLLAKCKDGAYPVVYGGLVLIVSPDFSILTVYRPDNWWFYQYPHVAIPSHFENNPIFRCIRAMGNMIRNRRGSYWH